MVDHSDSSDYSDIEEFPIAENADSDVEDEFPIETVESNEHSSSDSEVGPQEVHHDVEQGNRMKSFANIYRKFSKKPVPDTSFSPKEQIPTTTNAAPESDSEEDLDAGLDSVLGLTKDETHVDAYSTSSEEKESVDILGLSRPSPEKQSSKGKFVLQHVQYGGIDDASNDRDLSTFAPLDRKKARAAFDQSEIPPVIPAYDIEMSVGGSRSTRTGRSGHISSKSPRSATSGLSVFSGSIAHSDAGTLSRHEVETVVGPVPESFVSSLKGFFDLSKRTDVEIFIMALIIVSLLTLIILMALVIAKKR